MKHMPAMLTAAILVAVPCVASEAQSDDTDSCKHEWIRDPDRINVEYCSLPPQYDYICRLCGARKIDVAPGLSDVNWPVKYMMDPPEGLGLIKTAEGTLCVAPETLDWTELAIPLADTVVAR